MGADPRALVFVDDLDAPVLSAEDRHHLERVLRLRPGDLIAVSDGRGGVVDCRFGTALEPVGPVERRPPPSPPVTVAFSLVKGERPEWVVQKLTEVGVDRIVPLAAARSVVRWDRARQEHHLHRLRRVSREAAMQSRRAWLPVVESVHPFVEVVRWPGAALLDRGGGPPSLSHPCVLVGPEGGWSNEERATGAPRVGLGSQILRSETAAMVAGFLLCALRESVLVSADP